MPRAIQSKNKMRPELELVVCCARAQSLENDARIRALVGQGLNWDEVVACALRHKLGTILQQRIVAVDASSLAPHQRERLLELARDLAKINLSFTGEVLALYGRFEAAGIPAVPFKGPALAWLAYPDFTQRTCVDLDFVLPQRYIPDAVALLQSDGYTPQFSAAEIHAGHRGPVPGQYAFAPAGRRKYLELHTERTLRYFSRPLNLDEMDSRLISLEIGGRKLRTFSVEDLLVMLSVHGAKHFWERLAWVVDIAQLVSNRDVDWTKLSEIAESMASTRLLLLGLHLADGMLGAPVPQELLERARADVQVQRLASEVFEQYSAPLDANAGVLPRALFRLRSSDGLWRGLRQLLRLGLSPTESDREAVELPGFLSPLYTVVRPLRLLAEYGLGLHRRSKPDVAVRPPAPPETTVVLPGAAEEPSARVARKGK
jgi:hypothetical protein